MPTEPFTSDLEDPLHSYSYLSLFPRTCRALNVVVKPSELSNLDSAHNVLNTLALKEASKNMEQARMVLESGLEDNVDADVQKEDGGVGRCKDGNDRKRRPGLGRAPAKFDINRRVSQPAVVKMPELDISKLGDPEEFFLAHERLENAKKELRKQSGILTEMEFNLNEIPLKRPRRPGISRKSKATFKPHFPPVVSNEEVVTELSAEETDKGLQRSSVLLPPESLVLSQESSKLTNRSSLKESEATDSIKDGVLDGSMSEVNGFLDQILSGTYDHLNSEEHLTMLQEQLQIKPISIDNLSLPKLPDIPNYDFRISGNISKPRKSKGAFTGMNTKTPVKATQSPALGHFSASPTPPKSPFANLSALMKHSMQLSRSKDPFSDFDSDPYSEGGSSPVNCADEQPVPVEVPADYMPTFKVHSEDEHVAAVSCKSLHHELLQESGSFPGQFDDISKVVVGASSIRSTKSGSGVVGDNSRTLTDPHNIADNYDGSQSIVPSEIQMPSGNTTGALNTSEPDICAARGPSAQEQESSGAEVQAEHVSMEMNSPQHESSIDNMHSLGVEFIGKQSLLPDIGPVQERDIPEKSINHKRKGKRSLVQEQNCAEVSKQQKRQGKETAAPAKESNDDRSSFPGAGLHENQSEIQINHPKQQKELMDVNVPKTSLNNKSQANNVSSQKQTQCVNKPIHPKKKRKEVSLRKSIAVAGTYFESGIRKSKRFRTRPLEFWRGERLLYGRLEPDSTLPTLIGVKKYDTPSKNDGNALLKVEDRVDGIKYRELIDLAALH